MKPQGCCKDCKDRWVTVNDRCHAHCERYIAYQKELDAWKDVRNAELTRREAINSYETERSIKYRKIRERCRGRKTIRR